MTTTMTMTTTMMMATIDIPSSGDVAGAASGVEEDVRAATTPALTGSLFALGERQDRVLKVMSGDVKISSTSAPDKHMTLTTKRWARLISICEKVDVEAREVNRQTRPVAYRAHRYYVSGYGCVDICRFYVPHGLASNGLGLCVSEWAHLLELVPTIHEQPPELNAIAESSEEETEKRQ